MRIPQVRLDMIWGKENLFQHSRWSTESKNRTRSLPRITTAYAAIKRWRKGTLLICSEYSKRLSGYWTQPRQRAAKTYRLPNVPTVISHSWNIQRWGHYWKVMPTEQEKWAQHKKTLAPILTVKSCFCNNNGPHKGSMPQHLPTMSVHWVLWDLVSAGPAADGQIKPLDRGWEYFREEMELSYWVLSELPITKIQDNNGCVLSH